MTLKVNWGRTDRAYNQISQTASGLFWLAKQMKWIGKGNRVTVTHLKLNDSNEPRKY